MVTARPRARLKGMLAPALATGLLLVQMVSSNPQITRQPPAVHLFEKVTSRSIIAMHYFRTWSSQSPENTSDSADPQTLRNLSDKIIEFN